MSAVKDDRGDLYNDVIEMELVKCTSLHISKKGSEDWPSVPTQLVDSFTNVACDCYDNHVMLIIVMIIG